MKVLIVIEKTETGYSAYSPDIPGCVATAREELERTMREAISFHLEGLRAEGLRGGRTYQLCGLCRSGGLTF